MAEQQQKLAVILFNLGGPDSLDAVKPFLTHLFEDPAIIAAPFIIRWLLARYIAFRRAPIARRMYEIIGGASPLLANTEDQARALEVSLADLGEVRCFIAMRYWHPLSDATVDSVKRFAPDRLVLLPLYPQFSRTTSGSSLADWRAAAAKGGLDISSNTICCYPTNPDYVAALAQGLRTTLSELSSHANLRVLFSAHGLPKKFVAAGDPYQWQIEQTAAAVVTELAASGLDWTVCYQSRVGRLEWLGPYTEHELERAADDNVGVVVVPIAFVSEHSETLVELDVDYRQCAERLGVPFYRRVPTLGTETGFVAALAAMVRQAAEQKPGVVSGVGQRICPAPMHCLLSASTGGAGE